MYFQTVLLGPYGQIGRSTQTRQQSYNQAYFSGLAGLGADDRAEWEKQYAKEIRGLDDDEKDNFFRNTVFLDIFGNSKNEEDKAIYENRFSLTRDDRDKLVAQKTLGTDIDGRSDLQGSSLDVWKAFIDPNYRTDFVDAHFRPSAREGAMLYLGTLGDELEESYIDRLQSLDHSEREAMLNSLDSYSEQVSSHYQMYNGTDKLNLSEEEKMSILAKYLANNEAGGNRFATMALSDTYQNIVASKQSTLEKVWNSGANFIDSGVGMLIRAAGMAGGALGIGLEEGESWLDNVIDNTVTRYGDNVATTSSYDWDRLWTQTKNLFKGEDNQEPLPESEQERLKELGFSDNPILNTVRQQNSLVSFNTPFELFGQYGFTAASTILSFGTSAAVQGAAKVASWTGKAAMGGKTLTATSAGTKFLRGVVKTKNIANLLVPGAVGTVEGGMNAAMTKEETLKGLQSKINDRYTTILGSENGVQSEEDIDRAILGNDLGKNYAIAKATLGKGFDATKGYTSAEIAQLVKQKYRKELKAAEESANTAMYYDFWTNSVINGMVNSTWKASQQAPRVQNALRKIGLGGGETPVSEAINVARQGDRWVAQAKQMTKGQAFKGRLKEAMAEGFEEYSQDISSSFAQAYAQDKMQQYIDNKYGANPGTTAAQNDFWQSFGAGLKAAVNTTVSFDAIKSGLYGALSTALGGPNIGMKQGANGNMTAKGITWRSAFTPLFNNTEKNAVNQQREKMAEHFNSYFADETMQRAFFNVGGTAEWLTQYQQGIESKDEKAARDARVGERFSNIITLNDLKGTGYYETVMTNLQARTNFEVQNLKDPNSEESKAVDQFMASVVNRAQNISREEALQTIQKSSKEMLDMIDMVAKETRSIEKVFGENIDRDVKASMVFNKVVIDDYKKRVGQLDKEINKVTDEINSLEGSSTNSGLSSKAQRIMAIFGSLSNASKELNRLEQKKAEIDRQIDSIERGKRRRGLTQEEQTVYAMIKPFSRSLAGEIKAIKDAIEDYSFEAKHQEIEEDGISHNKSVDSMVLSASEIMRLSAKDRAFMLDPKYKDRYSAEQQAEIDKVNSIGASIYQDFAKKVEDRSRIERDYKAALNSQANLISNPGALNMYVTKVKYQAQQRMLQKKNEDLLVIAMKGDYQTFSERLDDIYNSEDAAEIAAVEDMLSTNKWYDVSEGRDMFARYSKENKKKKDIYDWIEKNKIFEKGDPRADVFAATLDYLSNRGIDITDIKSAVPALLADIFDKHGNNLGSDFENHLGRANEKASLEEQVTGYNSLEETVETYKDIMRRYNSDRQQRELNNEEIIPIETPKEASAPPHTPDPTPSGPTLFDIGGATPEAGHLTEEGEVVGSATVTSVIEQVESAEETLAQKAKVQSEATQSNSTIDAFTENSNEEVAKAAEVALKITENTPSFTAETKEEVKGLIEGLADNSFDTVQEFTEAILARANTLDRKADENETQVPDLLRHVAAKVSNFQVQKKSITPSGNTRVSSFFDRRRKAIRTQARKMEYQFTTGEASTSILITSINIAYIRQNYPDSPVVKYYDQYGIEDALMDNVVTANSEIMFITDDALTHEVKSSMVNKGIGYTEKDLPIVAVVEASNGPITINIDGQDKHFQPIGVMPSTGTKGSAGSYNMAPIRSLASGNTGISLVKNTDGSPVITKPFGRGAIHAIPNYDSSRRGQENNNVLDVAQNDLSEKERGTPLGYQKAKRNFLKRLDLEEVTDPNTGKKRKKIVFRINKLNGETLNSDVFVAQVQNTQNEKGESVSQVKDNADKLINFNSRTRRTAKAIAKFIKGFTDEDFSFSRDGDKVTPLGDTAQELEAMATSIRREVNNFIYLSDMSGWHYDVQASTTEKNGKREYSISLVNDDSSVAPIHLTTIYQGMSEQDSEAAQYEFLRNLLMEENGEVRMSNKRDSLVQWQVPVSDVKKAAEGNEGAKNNLSDIYDDGILQVDPTTVSFKYTIQGIVLNNPFKGDGSPVYQIVANPSNAAPSPPVNQPTVISTGQVNKDGAVIDSDTGAVIEGKAQVPINSAIERAKKIVAKIIEDSKFIKLSDDGSTYIDEKGTTYARVTSIIDADEAAGLRYDTNSDLACWITPSTNIGTGIDTFVRDFFAGTATDFSKYPNVTPEALREFAKQLSGFKNYIEANGLTVVPRDVTVTGQVEVADNNGKVHTINVAGTLDLLAYDGKGNFYIFDMKTHWSKEITAKKKKKFARQLSLYKEFLEKKYGVQVKALNIIPIKVDYPSPMMADYSVSAESQNQLLIDGKEFRGANPMLEQTFPVPYTELKIVYDKLTDSEKAMLSGIEEALNTGTGVVETSTEPIVPAEAQVASPAEVPINPTLGVGVDMGIGNGLFDTDFSGGLSWDMTRRLTPVPHHLQWSNLSQEQRNSLEAKGFTKETWSQMEDQEMEQELGCL